MYKPNVNSCAKMNSKAVRATFLDFFSNTHKHRVVRSSPVVPYCDNSIAFVNSGMCQFKNIFLGKSEPPHTRVVNSQKCIRVGGKHNDLACAGKDRYHHTFFEMLGNWSFNDYYKQEACKMALDFLTKPPVSLPLSRLYFTYFGGYEPYNLPCDEETRHIWQELGVPDSHIKKEGMASNFWEMGNVGPCGFCSEIHFDLKNEPDSALMRLNNDSCDLVEIWNIVFISHNRINPNTILPLSKRFIDTGLGFERLVTILQNQSSTYDTDLFQPLLETITKVSKVKPYTQQFTNVVDLDTYYRMLSDFSRMITVSLSDNMFPDATPKLRSIVREALIISEDVFKVKNGRLLQELSYQVASVLGDSYPEISKNLTKVQKVLSEESRIFDNLRQTAAKDWKRLLKSNPELKHLNIMEEPGLVRGVKYLSQVEEKCAMKLENISGDLAFTLYDAHGLSKSLINQIAVAKKLSFDESAFDFRLQEAKAKSKRKANTLLSNIDPRDLVDIPITDDSCKYDFTYDMTSNKYVFPSLDSNILAVVIGEQIFYLDQQSIVHSKSKAKIDSIYLEKDSPVGFVLNKTNFYRNAGGQVDDVGFVILENLSDTATVPIDNLVCVDGKIVHFGKIDTNFNITPKINCRLNLDEAHRTGCMRAHTTSHLLNAALHRTLTCTYQKSCHVSCDVCVFDFSVYGESLDVNTIASIENFLRDIIARKIQISRKIINSTELANLPLVTLIPGEVYPEDISLIEICDSSNVTSSEYVISREPCCGTHVHNTAQILSCCIVKYKSYNYGVRSIKCLTGELAHEMIQKGKEFHTTCSVLNKSVNQTLQAGSKEELEQNSSQVKKLKKSLEAEDLPFTVRKQCHELLQSMGKSIKSRLNELSQT